MLSRGGGSGPKQSGSGSTDIVCGERDLQIIQCFIVFNGPHRPGVGARNLSTRFHSPGVGGSRFLIKDLPIDSLLFYLWIVVY